MARFENRVQLTLAAVVGLLLLANLFTLALVAMSPAARAARAPVLFTVFLITLVVSVPSLLLIPRWLLKPYRQLIDEAERAPVAAGRGDGERDETEFVLKTFQEVVAQLRAKQRELERLTAQASARAATAERFTERVVASLPSGLLAVDSAGRTTVINGPAREILGAGETAGGRGFREILEGAPDLAGLIDNCLRTGEVYRREEVTARPGGGQVRRLGVTVAPVEQREGGEGRGALCLLTDITEVAALREALALKRNLESLGEMSAGLAHEFKNSLATLHGYAQLMQTLGTDERSRSSADALLEEVRGLSEMVTSFLNFARPRPLELSEVSLRELVESCAADLRPLFEERGVRLSVEGEFPEIRGDERMLRQALLNLMRNAAEAIPEEAQARAVTVHGAREQSDAGGERAVVEVEDSGAGLAAEDLQRIFIPFFTTKAKGHGVGLALAHRVVTQHGGTLSARNAEAGGAVFTVVLPA
jgi:PAS domain S-box-containing protein